MGYIRLSLRGLERLEFPSFKADCQKRGLVFKIYEKVHMGTCFPPYLYGEEPPGIKLLYESDVCGARESTGVAAVYQRPQWTPWMKMF